MPVITLTGSGLMVMAWVVVAAHPAALVPVTFTLPDGPAPQVTVTVLAVLEVMFPPVTLKL